MSCVCNETAHEITKWVANVIANDLNSLSQDFPDLKIFILHDSTSIVVANDIENDSTNLSQIFS